jgi:enoyl-CoA hydratase/carnithine racemase
MQLDHPAPGVARITFNRPEKRNAMNREARRQLLARFGELEHGPSVIVLTGGGPAFCAGVDLKELNATEGSPLDDHFPWIAVQEAIRTCPAIVIAAVNGYALGGGVTLINSADLAIADEQAQIGMPEVGFGLYPGLAGPSTQLRLAPKRSAWLVLTGERISGRTAAEWGLVNVATTSDRLQDETIALASQIASYDPETLRWCKKALWQVPMHLSDWTAALEYGESVDTQIRARTDAVGNGLENFSAGRRSASQGADPGRARL